MKSMKNIKIHFHIKHRGNEGKPTSEITDNRLFPFRNLQCGTRMRKTVVPSDSGYLTTEGSEKTIGDVSISMLYQWFVFIIVIVG